MTRAVYIRLDAEEYDALVTMAARDLRSTHDQAKLLIRQGLARWQLQQGFEASLPPMADEPIEGAA
jgi:hypothetical protein